MKCRVTNCGLPHAEDQIACRKHWFQLPTEVRRRIWDLYRNGPASEHVEACHKALESLNRRAAREGAAS
jgi:hypothetical protein